MYKLTVIAGPNRGSSYAVGSDGELTVGRQTGNTIVLPSSKVSKRHCTFVVSGGNVSVKDLGSSNGTFVNGILTKIRPLKVGDRISVGEFVLELVEPANQMSAAPMASGFGNSLQIGSGNSAGPGSPIAGLKATDVMSVSTSQPPADIKGKVFWYFEHRLMPIFYALNLKYEWRSLLIGAFGVLLVGNLLISVYPLIESSRRTVIRETGKRAKFMAQEIAQNNSAFLASRAETKTYVGMAENAEGVKVAALLDLESRILAPGSRMNQYLAVGSEANVAVKARDAFRAGREVGFVLEADFTTVVAIEPVKILSPQLGKNVVVAMALVSIDTTLATPDIGDIGIIYSETLILTGLLALFILVVLYRTTLKPLELLNEDMDKALKGDLPQVTHEFKFQELNPLWEIINSAIQRIPKGASGSIEAGMSIGATVDDYLGPLRTLGNTSKNGLIVFDGDKRILYVNGIFEELTGIRSDSAIGQAISDVARDQSFGVFTGDILDRTPTGGEGLVEDYDFSGVAYKVYSLAFGPVGGAGVCFALTLDKVETG